MPEPTHTMTYAPLSDVPAAASVYQCCDQWCYQAPQAAYHLWHEHSFTAEGAWTQVDAVRYPPTPPIATQLTSVAQNGTIAPPEAAWTGGDTLGVVRVHTQTRQDVIDASANAFRTTLTPWHFAGRA